MADLPAPRPRRKARRAAASSPSQVTSKDPLGEHLRSARVAALLGRPAPSADSPADPALAALIERTAATFASSIADQTRATYARRWHLFETWCSTHGLVSLPAAPETVMLYIAETAGDGVALGTLRGWMAALNRVHIEAGHPPPGDDPAMSLFLRGLSRFAEKRRPLNVDALRIAQLRQICASLERQALRPRRLRDRAILVLHRAGLSDGAVSRLMWTDLTMRAGSVVVRVAPLRAELPPQTLTLRSRTDPTDCPVDALSKWRTLAEDDHPWVFGGIDDYGTRSDRALTAKSVFSARRSRLQSSNSGGDVDAAIRLLGLPDPEVTRDRALILLGFAGAFRRIDLVRLTWADVTVKPQGAVVHLDRSKTDREGRGRDVGIPRGASDLTCPTLALDTWRSVTAGHLDGPIADRPIFVGVGRSGRLRDHALTPEGITRLVKRRAEQADLDGHWGGRSLRAGFISTAADLDIPLEQIARQSRHATLDTLMLYIRNDDPFRRNSASNVGL